MYLLIQEPFANFGGSLEHFYVENHVISVWVESFVPSPLPLELPQSRLHLQYLGGKFHSKSPPLEVASVQIPPPKKPMVTPPQRGPRPLPQAI